MSTRKQAIEMMRTPDGVILQTLLDTLGTIEEVFDFLETLGDRPWLLQDSDEETGEWEGQPIVWDGGFDLQDGKLVFAGWAAPSGEGGPTQRQVRPTDRIIM